MDRAMKQSTSHFEKNIFSYLKMFSINAEKTLPLNITRKKNEYN